MERLTDGDKYNSGWLDRTVSKKENVNISFA